MLSIANVGGSRDAGRYYEKTDDYYTKDRSPSQWQGKACAILKLKGEVVSDDFKKLLDGMLPNGENIHIPEAGRRGGTDLTFSAPKSVSMQALIGGDLKLIDAHDKAVSKALEYAETLVSYRQTIAGETTKILSQNMLAATFRHELSRACDPQLHTHCVVLNMTQREDKKWRAIDNEQFYQQKMLMGAFYRAELAREVQTLGYEVRILDSNGLFELEHISDKQIEAFSQRSQAIEAVLKKDGNTRASATPEAKQIITIATRPKKSDVDRNILRAYWQGLSLKENIDYKPKLNTPQGLTSSMGHPIKLVQFAIEHSMERQSVVTKPQILRAALQQGVGKVTFDEIQTEMNRRLKVGLLLRHGERLTTPEAITREKLILNTEKNGRHQTRAVTHKDTIDFSQSHLNADQKNAAQLILTTTDQIVGVQGLAGTGKTTMLQIVTEHSASKGFTMLGLAPSAAAAEELAKTGMASQTMSAFQALQTRELSSKSILVLDEAGMVSSAQMDFVLREAKKHAAKVVLVGDVQQLKAVEAGKPFAQLQANGMATAHMSAIQRQINPNLKAAVALAARGRVAESITLLQKSIIELKQPNERYQQIAKDYTSLSMPERESTLVVAGTNEARKAINHQVRAGLSLAGKGCEINTLASKDLTKAQKKDTQNYQAGDLVCPQRNYSSLHLNKGEIYSVRDRHKNFITLQKPDGSLVRWKPNEKSKVSVYQSQKQEMALGEIVRITKNNRQQGLVNGDRARIIKIDANKNLYCQRKNGKVFKLDGSKALHLEYGYCSTVHSAQGKTCNKVLIEADTKSLTSAKDNFYVAISRAKQEAIIYTNDKTKLPEAMSRKNEKEAALELNR